MNRATIVLGLGFVCLLSVPVVVGVLADNFLVRGVFDAFAGNVDSATSDVIMKLGYLVLSATIFSALLRKVLTGADQVRLVNGLSVVLGVMVALATPADVANMVGAELSALVLLLIYSGIVAAALYSYYFVAEKVLAFLQSNGSPNYVTVFILVVLFVAWSFFLTTVFHRFDGTMISGLFGGGSGNLPLGHRV
jgi:hypothetical protein